MCGTTFEEKKALLTPFDKETIRMLKDCINEMSLSSENDFLTEALKKLKEKRTSYLALGIKSDDNIGQIIDIRYKKLLTIPEENLA